MSRPEISRCVRGRFTVDYFKPASVPSCKLKEIVLQLDEIEALRLKDVRQFDQIVAAKKMKISQSTLQRILVRAHQKIAIALVRGKAIRIKK